MEKIEKIEEDIDLGKCLNCFAQQYNEQKEEMCIAPVCIKEYDYDPEERTWTKKSLIREELIGRKIRMEKIEKGYFLKLVKELKEKNIDPEAMYDIISSRELRNKARNSTILLAFYGVEITEYSRVMEQPYIRDWKIRDSCDNLILEKISREKVNQIKFNRIIRSIRFNLKELEKIYA